MKTYEYLKQYPKLLNVYFHNQMYNRHLQLSYDIFDKTSIKSILPYIISLDYQKITYVESYIFDDNIKYINSYFYILSTQMNNYFIYSFITSINNYIFNIQISLAYRVYDLIIITDMNDNNIFSNLCIAHHNSCDKWGDSAFDYQGVKINYNDMQLLVKKYISCVKFVRQINSMKEGYYNESYYWFR